MNRRIKDWEVFLWAVGINGAILSLANPALAGWARWGCAIASLWTARVAQIEIRKESRRRSRNSN